MAQRENSYGKKHYDSAFAQEKHFIVTPGNSTPPGVLIRTVIIQESTNGFSCIDLGLHEDSGDYSTAQIPGMQYNGTYTDVAIASSSVGGAGSVFCVFA